MLNLLPGTQVTANQPRPFKPVSAYQYCICPTIVNLSFFLLLFIYLFLVHCICISSIFYRLLSSLKCLAGVQGRCYRTGRTFRRATLLTVRAKHMLVYVYIYIPPFLYTGVTHTARKCKWHGIEQFSTITFRIDPPHCPKKKDISPEAQ